MRQRVPREVIFVGLSQVLVNCRYDGRPDRSFHELQGESQSNIKLDALLGHDQVPVHAIATDQQPITLPSRGQRKLSIQVLGDLTGATSRFLDAELMAASDIHPNSFLMGSFLV